MEGVDSPLEVLSLAATMVQDSCLPPSYEEARKELPSARWRRERRARDRLPDYATATADNERPNSDAPLDMTTRSRLPASAAESALSLERLRGSPPSYTESISKPGYRMASSLSRPSVITCTPSNAVNKTTEKEERKGTRKEFLTGDGMCDPVIDEHFRRSLGKDYMNLFAKKSTKSSTTNGSSSINDEEDSKSITGLSVDDHFAKALGDTWVKLQAESSLAKKSATQSPKKTVKGLATAYPIKNNKKAPAAPPTSTTKEASSTRISHQRRGLVSI